MYINVYYTLRTFIIWSGNVIADALNIRHIHCICLMLDADVRSRGGGGGEVGLMRTKADKGGGGVKNNFLRMSFMDDP